MLFHEDDRYRYTHDVGNFYCGDLLKGRLFNVELFETVMFRSFNGADSTV
jgi:hypothetical protein